MNYKLHVHKHEGYNLELYWHDEKERMHECYTEYTVEWDDDLPMVHIEYISDASGNDLNVDNFDIEALCQDLERFPPSAWYEDRMGSMIDDAMDRLEDR